MKRKTPPPITPKKEVGSEALRGRYLKTWMDQGLLQPGPLNLFYKGVGFSCKLHRSGDVQFGQTRAVNPERLVRSLAQNFLMEVPARNWPSPGSCLKDVCVLQSDAQGPMSVMDILESKGHAPAADSGSTVQKEPTPVRMEKASSSRDASVKRPKKLKKPTFKYLPEARPAARSQYSSARLRKKAPVSYAMSGTQVNPLTLLNCAEYSSQPFKVRVHSNVYLMMDVHAHMAETEIIGFLGGTWNAEAKDVTVLCALPCKTLGDGADDDETINVEMDPVSAATATNAIRDMDLIVIGWYHSHPHFVNNPSVRDVENQGNYQSIANNQPFVGAIVSPYDEDSASQEKSTTRWFNTIGTDPLRSTPYAITTETVPDTDVSDALLDSMVELARSYQDFPRRVQFSSPWKDKDPNSMSKLEKMRISLQSHMPSMNEQVKAKVVDRIATVVQQWSEQKEPDSCAAEVHDIAPESQSQMNGDIDALESSNDRPWSAVEADSSRHATADLEAISCDLSA